MIDVLRILIAPLVWLAAFSAVYGLHGLLCGHGITGDGWDPASLPRTILTAAYGLAILVQAALLVGLYAWFTSPSSFVRFVSRATGWVGLLATIWTLAPVVATTYCV